MALVILSNYLNFKWSFSLSYDRYKTFADSINRAKLYKEDFRYDGNGNILSLGRIAAGLAMDNLGYVYNRDAAGKLVDNKLFSVTDTVPGTAHTAEPNGTNTYTYDAIGNLIEEKKDGTLVAGFDWNVYGKISKVTKPQPSNNIIGKTDD